MLAFGNLRLGVAPLRALTIKNPQAPTMRITIIAVDGQSNQAGQNPGLGSGGNISETDVASDPRILQWSGDVGVDTLNMAEEPLPHPNRAATPSSAIGPALPMAKALAASMGENDRVVIACLAVGGTGFVSDGRWAIGGDLHENAVARLVSLKTTLSVAYPDHSLELVFIGPAGEDDVVATQNSYLSAVTAAYADIKNRLGMADAMVIKARISSAWRSTTFGGNAIDSAQIRLRERLAHTVIIDSPDGPYDPNTSVIHFNADAQVAIGKRLAAAVPLARGRAYPVSSQVDFLDGLSSAPRAAFSLYRRLTSRYDGAAYRLRRLSDGTTEEIGFDAEGLVDVSAATRFCTGTEGRIDRLYDQSGNGLDFSANGANPRPLLISNGQMQWRRGRPMMGGNNGSLIAPFEPSLAGSFFVAGSLTTDGSRQTISSRSLILYRVAGGPLSIGTHNVATGMSFPLTAGVHTIIGSPTPSASRAILDGREQLSTGPNIATVGTYAGATTLLARQSTASGNLQQIDTSLLAELVFSDDGWNETDLALVKAATVASYLMDPVP